MKELYLVSDDFARHSKINKYRVINEDADFYYCAAQESTIADWVVDKCDLYHVQSMKEGYSCFGFDLGLVDYKLMRKNLVLLESENDWRNSEKIALLKKMLVKKEKLYNSILEEK